MMKCTVLEIINWFHNGYKDEIVGWHEVSADTKEDLFKKVYSFDRSARYDNARKYRIRDVKLHAEYMDWKKSGVTLEMYYGDGTVD